VLKLFNSNYCIGLSRDRFPPFTGSIWVSQLPYSVLISVGVGEGGYLYFFQRWKEVLGQFGLDYHLSDFSQVQA